MITHFEKLSVIWEEEKTKYVKESTICAYKMILRSYLIPAFGRKTWICEKDVQDFVISSLKRLSQKTVKDSLVVLKMVCKYGEKKRLFRWRQMEIVFPVQEDKKHIKILSRADQKTILDYARTQFSFQNLGIEICLNTGIRIGEICGLRWDDIDLEKGELQIKRTVQRIYTNNGTAKTKLIIDTPKTQSSIRAIPISDELAKVIRPLKRVVNESFYVISNRSEPIEPRVYRKYFEKTLNCLGIERINFHGMRHTFATRCIETNADYKTVSAILGHSNISTTLNLYVHPNSEQKKKCIEKMLHSL